MNEIVQGNRTADDSPRWNARPGLPFGLLVMATLPFLFLSLPVLALAWRTIPSGQWISSLKDPVVTQALLLSLGTTFLTLILVVGIGTPVAYLLARYRFPGYRVVDTVIDLPMVLPPAVAGLALLMLLGRRGLLGGIMESLGITIAFTTTAVILAQAFVSAPFYIRSARAGFEAVDPTLERVAATLGESELGVFFRVTIPLAFPSLIGGAVMAWARALGEFGATIMFAGNFPGRTQTMSLAVYTVLESDLWAALTLAMLLVFLSFIALITFRAAIGRATRPTHSS